MEGYGAKYVVIRSGRSGAAQFDNPVQHITYGSVDKPDKLAGMKVQKRLGPSHSFLIAMRDGGGQEGGLPHLRGGLPDPYPTRYSL